MVHYPTDIIAGLFIETLAGELGYLNAKAIMSAHVKNVKRNSFDLAVKLRKKA